LLSWCLAPFVWQVLTSLRPSAWLAKLPPWLPPELTLDHYRVVLSDPYFLRVVWNSLGVAAWTSAASLGVGALAGFALALLRPTGGRALLAAALGVSMLPGLSVVGPLFLAVRRLGLRDTWTALVVSHCAFTLPLTLWVARSVFRAVPADLFKAALVDGLTPFGAFWRIYLPLAKGGLAACAILSFIFSWNEFVLALTFTTTEASRTVPVGIALLQGVHELPFGELAAASVLVSLPVVFLAMAFQRGIVSGLTAGAVKG